MALRALSLRIQVLGLTSPCANAEVEAPGWPVFDVLFPFEYDGGGSGAHGSPEGSDGGGIGLHVGPKSNGDGMGNQEKSESGGSWWGTWRRSKSDGGGVGPHLMKEAWGPVWDPSLMEGP